MQKRETEGEEGSLSSSDSSGTSHSPRLPSFSLSVRVLADSATSTTIGTVDENVLQFVREKEYFKQKLLGLGYQGHLYRCIHLPWISPYRG